MKKTDKKRVGIQEARALARIAGVAATVREGLHELVVRSGLGVVAAMLEAGRETLCGRRYEHSEHEAHRAGHVAGELAMGGRRVQMERPRVRSVSGRELQLPTWEEFATNPIENLNSLTRRTCGCVKRWRNGEMILRWMTAATSEATNGFRRLKGHAGMPLLIAWLRRHDAAIDGTSKVNVAA